MASEQECELFFPYGSSQPQAKNYVLVWFHAGELQGLEVDIMSELRAIGFSIIGFSTLEEAQLYFSVSHPYFVLPHRWMLNDEHVNAAKMLREVYRLFRDT